MSWVLHVVVLQNEVDFNLSQISVWAEIVSATLPDLCYIFMAEAANSLITGCKKKNR